MPFTPLHFGPALLVREIVGEPRFSLWAFFTTQLAFDFEPGLKMLFDLPGGLHEFTHNPLYGSAVALIVTALFWKRGWFAALLASVFGVVSHLWLDMLYHADVAQALAKWSIAEHRNFDAELICLLSFFFWLLLVGVKKTIRDHAQ